MERVSGWIAVVLIISTFFLAIRSPALNKAFGHLKKQLLYHHYLALGFLIFTTWHFTMIILEFGESWLLLFDPSSLSLISGWLAVLLAYALIFFAFQRTGIYYRRWRRLHLLTFLCFVSIFLHVYLIIEPQTWIEKAFFSMPFVIGSLCFSLSSIFPKLDNFGKYYRVENLHKINEQVYDLTISSCKTNDRITFSAGHFVYVKFLEYNFTNLWHPFTVISAPDNHNIEMVIKDRGCDTHQVKTLWINSPLRVLGPFGQEIWDAPTPQLWIACGIGVAIFVSGMRSIALSPRHRAHLMYCAVNEEQLLFREEMDRHARNNAGFSWQAYLCSGFSFVKLVEQHRSFINEFNFTRICGHPNFQSSVRHELIRLGIPRNRIILEGLR